MKRLENVILFMSPKGVMQFDGARLQPLSVSYDPTRYQKAEQLYIGGNVVGSFLRGAVAQLVNEQWSNLAKKATARAKARVSKAEKAVAALVNAS